MGGIPEAVLSSGEKIPLLGMGTGAGTSVISDALVSTFIDAIDLGYRHFDTAALYGTERHLGEAIAEALRRGIIKTRSELFITSKLWCTDVHCDRVLPALKNTLENLGLEYLDLYLIHWPVRLKPGEKRFLFNRDDLLPIDLKSVWEAMEECQKLGLTKSIGVSNFSSKKLLQLMAHAKIPPAVNQVEMNPAWQQSKLREFCNEHGIHVSAWSPLGANGAYWGSLAVMESPILKQIANAKGKSIAQVSLRWLYEQGVSAVVKSFNKERMNANLQIFDWELSEQDLVEISQIPQHRGFSGELFVSPGGPFKTIEEIWEEA
ncbi:non-functional NADPH-dependent codeinone reductase 2-like [Magnolia sinica]|uniref:non-functional NADPH-dependent codeinone reductase 2-like n=1 Tax=Magnolia sinica TaxID=86752 RepID=UPI00265B445C|nr:non-functional NADPH-dependent codeinone reductase 2-like [Magnolia sinica]